MTLKQLSIRMSPIPFAIATMMVISGAKQADAQGGDKRLENKQNFSKELLAHGGMINSDALEADAASFLDYIEIEQKADELCDQYLENMQKSQKKLAKFKNTSHYKTEVRKELPGATIGLHCMYGQYAQLTRAQKEKGDTITIIPKNQNAENACEAFRISMRAKYSAPEYADCIHSGKMYESNAAYDAAFEKFVSGQKGPFNNPDSMRSVLATRFAKTNFSIESVEPGTIMIVPRYWGSKTAFHAIMYPGVGIKDSTGTFVPTLKGVPMFIAHNNERLDTLFKTWDTRNVFAVDVKKIAMVEYSKELDRVKQMTRDELITFLASDAPTLVPMLQSMPDAKLQKLARAKYFGREIPEPQKPYLTAMNAPKFDLSNAYKAQFLQKNR